MIKKLSLKKGMEIFLKRTIKNNMYHKGSKWRHFLESKEENFFTLKDLPHKYGYELIDWTETIIFPVLKKRRF